VTVGEALARASKRIAPFDARVLLEDGCGVPGTAFVANPGAELDDARAQRFEAMVVRRERGEPVAYITGAVGFYGRTFCVDERVLVPRPETEHLVEAVLDHVRGTSKRLRLVDVGTGSGAIALTLAAEDERLDVVGVDVSPGAVAVASENARRLGLEKRARFLCGDLLDPLDGVPVDLIVANLPYIPTDRIPARPDPVGYEPVVALDGGADGLGPYRRLLAQAAGGGLASPGALYFEAAPGTIEPLADLAQAVFPAAGVEVLADYAGLDRLLAIQTS
jgi:release factor glutamine methyltransferase